MDYNKWERCKPKLDVQLYYASPDFSIGITLKHVFKNAVSKKKLKEPHHRSEKK